MEKILIHLGVAQSSHEPTIYLSVNNSLRICIGVYVDDFLVSRSSSIGIEEFKGKMKNMNNLGLSSSYRCIQVKWIRGEIKLSQKVFAQKILSDFNLQNCNPS